MTWLAATVSGSLYARSNMSEKLSADLEKKEPCFSIIWSGEECEFAEQVIIK